MAQEKAGRALTDAEVAEYAFYHNNQIAIPDEYANVVSESSTPGVTYRFATAEEVKAAKDEAERNLKVQEEAAALDNRLRTAAIKANAKKNELQVPDRPAEAVAAPVVQR
jgi:hypothetical protein